MSYPWFKLTTMGILRGSLSQSKDVVQLVWIKLLCLMSESKFRNGRFEYAPGKPYSLEFIAISCGVTKEILEGCLCEYEEDINPDTGEPRISIDADGTVILNNWVAYQKRKEEEKASQSVEVVVSPPSRPRQPREPRETRDLMVTDSVKRFKGKNGNVLLSDSEYRFLVNLLGLKEVETRIDALSAAISNGKQFENHCATIQQGGDYE